MNKYIYILFFIFFISTSCESYLLQNPDTTKTANNFYSTENEIEEAVYAVYATLQFSGNYDIALPAIGELPGEDCYDETPANDGGNYGQFDQFNTIPQNGVIGNLWKDAYKSIQRANIVLNRINSVVYADENLKKAREGEMKFIRALQYFNLVRIFGDVPLIVEEITNPQDLFGQVRTSKNEVYEQIELDLEEAISLLPESNESNKGRVVKTAAQTLKGKVQLTLGNYSGAETTLLKVVNSGSHKLLNNTNDVFAIDNELNEEIIFAVQFASGINSNSEGTDAYRMFNPTGRVEGNMTGTKGHGVIKGELYNLYAPNDARKDVYVGVLESGLAYNNKIAVPTTVIGDSESDWVVLRYADVLLMLAEIENELSKPSEAILYLNLVRNRANIGSYNGAQDKASIFQEIDLQRRLELIWEGHRWFDLLRQGRAKEVLQINDDNKLLMPLPASQIATDPALIQNPGY